MRLRKKSLLLLKNANSYTCICKKETVEELKVIRACQKDIYKEFLRQGEATIKWAKKTGLFQKLYKYAKDKYPDLYEKSYSLDLYEKSYSPEDIRKVNKLIKGWDTNVKPEKLNKVLDFWYPRAAEAGGNKALDKLGFSLAFNLKDSKLIEAFVQRGSKITGEISETTLKQFRSTLMKSYFKEGISPYETEKRIRGLFQQTYKHRSMTIARVETGVASATTSHTTYEKNGIEMKSWGAFLDTKTRDSHADLAGRAPIKIDQYWVTIDGNVLKHPLDPNGEPGEIINCRCYEEPVIEGWGKPSQPYTGGEDAVVNPNQGKSGYIMRGEQTYKPIEGEIGSYERMISRYVSRGYDITNKQDFIRLMKDYSANIRRRHLIRTTNFWKDAMKPKIMEEYRYGYPQIMESMRQLKNACGTVKAYSKSNKYWQIGKSVDKVIFDYDYGKINPRTLAYTRMIPTPKEKIAITPLGIKNSSTKTWMHEMGHRYFSKNFIQNWNRTRRARWAKFAELHEDKTKGYITDYARKDEDEDFAEMFSMMLDTNRRAGVKGQARSKYEWMKKYVMNKDYKW